MDLAKLKTELETDPLGRGYAQMADDVAAETFKLNDRQPDRESLEPALLIASMVRSEYDALAAAGKDYLRIVSASATPLPMTDTLKSQLGALFPAGTQTRTNFVALAKRPGNRAEELNLGGVPTASDIAKAKQL